MRVVMFYHSLLSDWNHGNAHFLRGIVSEFTRSGHDVHVWEPLDSWSLQNMLDAHGEAALSRLQGCVSRSDQSSLWLRSRILDEALDGATSGVGSRVERSIPRGAIGSHHKRSGAYTLLFHDTHHRSVNRS